MDIDELKKQWKPRPKRTQRLLVKHIDGWKREMDTSDWAFPIGYAFRDALDIKLTERVKTLVNEETGEKILDPEGKPKKTVVKNWTQGPIIAFKEGDAIYNTDQSIVIQVGELSVAMGWDKAAGFMYQGRVNYTVYKKGTGVSSEGIYQPFYQYHCSQMSFLRQLIHGLAIPNEVLQEAKPIVAI